MHACLNTDYAYVVWCASVVYFMLSYVSWHCTDAYVITKATDVETADID